MHLIAPLVSGIAGAESGTANIYKRGTATRATYYSTFEGSVHATSAAVLTLNSKGGAVIYVNELVDVVVDSTSAAAFLSFTAGDASGNVEVRSQSFTGTAYADAASAASNPTTLQAVLDKWKTNAGAVAGSIDWKVTSGGVSKTLANWMGTFAGNPLYNVKDPTYGAVGDGSNDDLTAIDLATAAASSAGGGVVFFPPGTYSISAVVDVPATVSLLGAGMESTTLQVDHSSEKAITTNATTYGTSISGLRITAGEANTGTVVDFIGACEITLSNCYIGGTNNNANTLVDSTAAAQNVTIRDCTFEPGSSTTDCIDVDNHTSGRYLIDNCRFICPATYSGTNAIIYGALCDVTNCIFDTVSSTSGTIACYKSDTTTLDASVTNCRFMAPGGATVTGITLGTYLTASVFLESGNIFTKDSDFTAYSYTTTHAQTGAYVQSITRETRLQPLIASDDGTITADPVQYGAFYMDRTGTTSATVNVTGNAPEGARFTLHTQGGGTGTITWKQVIETGTINITGMVPTAIQSGRHCACNLRSVDNGSIVYWSAEGGVMLDVAT